MPEPSGPINRLVLAGRTIDAEVAAAVTSASYQHGLEQAATLSIGLHDRARTLVRSKIATQRITCRWGNEVFVLVQVSKSGDELSLTFEEQAVNALRRVRGALKMERSAISRAGFARRLVLDPLAAGYVVGGRLSYWTPEFAPLSGKRTKRAGHALPPGQPDVKRNNATSSKRVPDVAPTRAAFGSARLTVMGAQANNNQRENAAICLATAAGMGASQTVLLAVLETIMVESSMLNLTGGDRDSVGLYQQRPSQGWKGLRNREEATREFVSRAIAVERVHPSWTPGQIAAEVQRPAAQYRGRYEQQRRVADQWLAAWQGQVTPDRQTGASGSGQGYEFSRGADESSWDAIKRLADELQWRAFTEGLTVVFAPDSALLKQPVAMRLNEQKPGVESIDFDFDSGKRAARCTVTMELDDTSAVEPGQVVVIEKLGVANGRWLVSDLTHDWLAAQSTVELVRAQPALPEPPDQPQGGTTTFTQGVTPSNASPGDRAVQWAQQFVGKAYKWGGGHGPAGVAAMVAYGNAQARSYTTGFDCSGLARCAWAQQGVDVGGTTYDQIARAQSAGVPHGTGIPPGGWQPGDLNYPHSGHVVIMTGAGSGAVEAQSSRTGIVASQRGSAYFWARWRGGGL
jgi:cell wall-associated NlpC family hydrolase